MKKRWLVGASLALVMVVAVVGLSGCYTGRTPIIEFPSEIPINFNSQQNGIWVNGTGEVTVTPDVATISLGITAQAQAVADAQSQATDAMNNVLTTLADNGVDDKDIQVQRYSISQVTRWDQDKQEEIVIGYRVTHTVNAKIRDIEKAGSIIDAVVIAGGDLTRIQGISLSLDDPTAYYDEAREKAMDDAKAKAEQLADLAGVNLGKPTYVSEGTIYVPDQRGATYYESAVPAAISPTISPGEMDITLTVQVAYPIQK